MDVIAFKEKKGLSRSFWVVVRVLFAAPSAHTAEDHATLYVSIHTYSSKEVGARLWLLWQLPLVLGQKLLHGGMRMPFPCSSALCTSGLRDACAEDWQTLKGDSRGGATAAMHQQVLTCCLFGAGPSGVRQESWAENKYSGMYTRYVFGIDAH